MKIFAIVLGLLVVSGCTNMNAAMNYQNSFFDEKGNPALEVVGLIGAPQIYTYQLIPPRKIWMYCRSATKTAFIGYNFILQITWYEDKVESAGRKFKI